jgi:hypothetical protein
MHACVYTHIHIHIKNARSHAHTHVLQDLLQALLQASRGFGRIWTNVRSFAGVAECHSNVGVVHPRERERGPCFIRETILQPV